MADTRTSSDPTMANLPLSITSSKNQIQGLLLGSYEVGKLLGQGTFAKVYHARKVKSGDSVEIKVIDKEKILKSGLIAHIKVPWPRSFG